MSCETRTGFSFNNPDTTSNYLAPGWGLIVTPDELRYDEMFGNMLIAEADSQSITDDQLNDYTRVMIGYLERELNIDILPRIVRHMNLISESGTEIERTDIEEDQSWLSQMDRKQKSALYIREPGYPYRVNAARRECFVKLRRRPVIELLSAKFIDPYFQNTLVDLMPYRYVKPGLSGVCYFKPRQQISRYTNFQHIWQHIFAPFTNDRQNIFLIDYKTGYENCQDVPDDLRNIIKKLAAVVLMNIYGDGKLAAIASRSVNLNSVSESINTTLSATSATFGARIIQYQKEIKSWMSQNRSKYSRTIFGNLGGN
jgi:hypothetical protein